jgi:hypothetical protein
MSFPLKRRVYESLPVGFARAGSSFVLSEYSVERLVERTMIVYRHVLDHA